MFRNSDALASDIWAISEVQAILCCSSPGSAVRHSDMDIPKFLSYLFGVVLSSSLRDAIGFVVLADGYISAHRLCPLLLKLSPPQPLMTITETNLFSNANLHDTLLTLPPTFGQGMGTSSLLKHPRMWMLLWMLPVAQHAGHENVFLWHWQVFFHEGRAVSNGFGALPSHSFVLHHGYNPVTTLSFGYNPCLHTLVQTQGLLREVTPAHGHVLLENNVNATRVLVRSMVVRKQVDLGNDER